MFEELTGWPWEMIGAITTILGFGLAIWQFRSAFSSKTREELEARRKELRLEEVHLWANQCIEQLQHLRLIANGDVSYPNGEKRHKVLRDIAITLSVQIEKGRLFFKNNQDATHGKSKQTAYQGYRPMILDQLVVSHQAALLWCDASNEKKVWLQPKIDDAVRCFVSLAQQEVGRQKAFSEYASGPGEDINLAKEMAADLEGLVEPASTNA